MGLGINAQLPGLSTELCSKGGRRESGEQSIIDTGDNMSKSEAQSTTGWSGWGWLGPSLPHLLLKQVLGQWAGRQLLDHQILALLADSRGQACRCGQFSPFLAWFHSSCHRPSCLQKQKAWGLSSSQPCYEALGSALAFSGPQSPCLYNEFLRKAAMLEYRLRPRCLMACSRQPGAFPRGLPRGTT